MNFKMSVIAGLVGLATAASAQAASVIGFDPDGTGVQSGTIQVGSFDWAPGSALAVNSIAGPGVLNSNFQVYAQGKLNGFLDGGGNPIADPAGLNTNYEITFQAAFGENAITPIPGTAVFTGINNSPSYNNYFKIFFDNNVGTFANALAGTGYGDGTQILSGWFNTSTGSYSVGLGNTALLDQFGVDNWGGTRTFIGAGGTINDIKVSSTDSNFFTDTITKIVLSLFNTSNITPFNQTDPSKTVVGVAPNLGAVNGSSGPDFLFQSDANQSFTVPEPGSLALLGLGLAAASLSRIKRRKAKAA